MRRFISLFNDGVLHVSIKSGRCPPECKRYMVGSGIGYVDEAATVD